MTLTNKLKELRRKEEGFTIVELLIVIVVIAILAALVITSYLGIQSRARDAERQSDIRAIATAVQAHATLNDGEYPTCEEISDGTVGNIEDDALDPPGTGGSFLDDVAAASGSNDYGCEESTTARNGVRLTWSEENGENNPQDRVLGNGPF